MPAVEVRSRIVGASPSNPVPAPVILDLLTEKLTVAELIRATVTEQIRDLLLARQMDMSAVRDILERQYLTHADVQQQASEGFIHTPSARSAQTRAIDTQAEVAKAITSFRSGVYCILVDGRQYDGLDEVVALEPRSRVTFLRVTPLIGG
jgi:hypothetical protein